MNKTKELQLNALDVLGKRHAEIGKQLDELSALTNPFDIEAKVYFIGKLAKLLETNADRIHAEMHTLHSADHPHICDQTSDKGVFDFIFGKGILALALMFLVGTASAWEKPRNPDRFISIGLSLDHDNLDGGYGPRTDDDHYMKVGEYKTDIESVQFDVRVPMSDSFTVSASVRRNSFQQKFNSQDPSLMNDATDQKGVGFGVGCRYYFNR